MTQPPKGGPAFTSTPNVAPRGQQPAAPAGASGSGPAASSTTASTSWSAPTEAPAKGAPANGSPANGSPATNGSATNGFGQPTISSSGSTNGGSSNGGVIRTAAPGALAALDAQAAAAAAAAAPPRPTPAPTAANTAAARRPARGPRRARLQLRHLNPWSVLKFSCVLSVFLFFMWMLTIAGLYEALNGAGIIGKINDTVTTINGSGSSAPVTVRRVLGGAVLIGVINMIMFIALSTVGSVIYNFISDLIGGVELTLSEGD